MKFGGIFLSGALLSLVSNYAAAHSPAPCPYSVVETAPSTSVAISKVIVTPTADVPCSGSEPGLGFNVSPFVFYDGSNGGGALDAELAVPLDSRFALQFDGTAGLGDNGQFLGQFATHLGYFDQEWGGIGGYASVSKFKDNDTIYRAGPELSLNMGAVELSVVGGWQSKGKGNVFFDSRLSLAASEETTFYAGYSYDSKSTGRVGIEQALSSIVPSATDSTVYGEMGLTSASDVVAKFGLKMNFGGSSLPNCPTDRPQHFASHWQMPLHAGKSTPVAAPPRLCVVSDCPPPDSSINEVISGVFGTYPNCDCRYAIP